MTKTTNNKPTLEELEQVELILIEANAYGLRLEVEDCADRYQAKDTNISRLDAVIMAYSEWIK